MRICIIGVRGHHCYIFEEIGLFPEVEIVGVSSGCSDDVSPLLLLCKKSESEPAVFENHLEMLDQLRPDAVAINGPFALHSQMCIEAMERGIHVLCEKPIALTMDDFYRVKTAYSNAQNVFLISMVGLRYHPCFMTAWKAVQDGAIGKVKLIHAQKSYKLGVRPDYYKTRQAYGGTIPWVGSHALDWIYWFSGSEFSSVLGSHTTDDNFGNGELEIAAQCQFLMKNGIQASASIDYLRPATASTHGDDRVRVAGTKGIIEVIGGRVTLMNDQGELDLSVDACPGLFSDFVRHIQGRSKALVNTEDTFILTKACLLARESADTGRLLQF